MASSHVYCLVLLFLLATRSTARGVAWQPARQQLAQHAHTPPAAPPSALDSSRESSPAEQLSRLSCVGTGLQSRACYFHNLYYDTVTQRFNIFGEQPHIFTNARAVNSSRRLTIPSRALLGKRDPGVPWLQLSAFDWKKEPLENRFLVAWHPEEAPPQAEAVCAVSEPLHLRAPRHITSLGHMLRDNFQALIEIPEKLGQEGERFTWLQMPTAQPGSADDALVSEYAGWLGNPKTYRWSDFLDSCRPDSGKLPRYVRFAEAIAGWGGLAMDVRKGEHPGIEGGALACSSHRFRGMRRVAYAAYGIDALPAPSLPRRRIVFLMRTEFAQRRILNVPMLKDALSARFPDADVVSVVMHGMLPEHQMRVLSRTSVLITTSGPDSLRFIYLPDGAQVIIAAVQTKFMGEVGTVPKFTEEEAYYEAETCFRHVGYIGILRYGAADPQDVQLGEVRQMAKFRGHMSEETIQLRDKLRVFDSSMRIDPIALGDAVQEAFSRMSMWGWRPEAL